MANQTSARRMQVAPLSLRDAIDSLFQESFVFPRGTRGDGMLASTTFPVDISETEPGLVVKAALPGVKPEDVNISVTGDVLTLRAEMKHDEASEQNSRYHRRELTYGSYERLLALPVEVDPDRAEATFEHGVLTLQLPKAAHTKPRVIKVNAQPGAAMSAQTSESK